MSPTNVCEALRGLGIDYHLRKGLRTAGFCEGINRIQFEGPWLDPGKPVALAYRYTHWIAARGGHVLDTLIEPARWIPEPTWRHIILTEYPAQEEWCAHWHITHHYAFGVPGLSVPSSQFPVGPFRFNPMNNSPP